MTVTIGILNLSRQIRLYNEGKQIQMQVDGIRSSEPFALTQKEAKELAAVLEVMTR